MSEPRYVVAIVADPQFGERVRDVHSRDPGYSAVEVFGAEPTPALTRVLAKYRLTEVSPFPGGFSAGTAGGVLADSPNYPDPPDHIDESEEPG